MKRSTETIIVLAALCLTGCVNGTASDTVSKSISVSFPAFSVPPVPTGSVVVSKSVTLDFSQALKDLAKVGTVSASLPVNTLSDGDLSFVKHIKLSATPEDNSLPPLVLADFDVPNSTTNSISIPVQADSSMLGNYFSEGAESLQFTFTVDHARALSVGAENGATVMYTVTVEADLSVNKSVTNIGH